MLALLGVVASSTRKHGTNMPVLSGSKINMVYGYFMDADETLRHSITGRLDPLAEGGVSWSASALCGASASKGRYLSTAVRDITCLQCFAHRTAHDRLRADVR